MSMGTSLLALMGRRDPREKLLQVQGGQPPVMQVPADGAQYPAQAEPEGGVYATPEGVAHPVQPPAQPVKPPEADAYKSPEDLMGMYKELLEYKSRADNMDRGIALLGSAFAQPENRANIINAFSPSGNSQGMGDMDPIAIQKGIMELRSAEESRVQKAAMLAQLPMIAKKYGIDDATAQMLYQTDQLDDFVAEREKFNNSKNLEDSKLANSVVLEGTKANLDIEKNPGITYHTVGGQLYQFDRKGQKLGVFGEKEMPDLEFREVNGQTIGFDKKTGKEVMKTGTPDSAYETIPNGDGTTMIVLKADPTKVVKTIGTPKNELTDDQKEFEASKADPALRQWLLDMKAASRAKTEVNVNSNESSEFQKALDKKRAEDYIGLQNKAMGARQMQGQYDLAEKALSSGLRTGFGADTELALRKVYATLGGDGDATKIAAGDLFKSVQNQLAMLKRNPESGLGLPGSVSDRDLQFLKDADINMQAGLEGNTLMLQAAKRLNQRNVDVAKMASDYLEKNGRLDAKFDQMIAEYAEANPLFADMDIKPISVEEKRRRAAEKFGITLDGK